MFTEPFSSRLLGIFKFTNLDFVYKKVDKSVLRRKGFLVKWDGETYVCELLHNALKEEEET